MNRRGLRRLDHPDPSGAEFLDGVVAGLSSHPKTLPCKFFYDAAGSRLFDRICRLPEYYPTRTECRILERHAAELAALIGPGAGLLEFGAGAGVKVRLLLDAMDRPAVYAPVDISREHLLAGAARLAQDYPRLRVAPLWADYTQSFLRPAALDAAAGRCVGFFPGSTIGNFTPAEAGAFLASTLRLLGPESLLIVGVDLVKDESTLVAAYDDADGVTAAFNLNLLRRINRELQGNFVIADFDHSARWNAVESRIEMHLICRRTQQVRVGAHRFDFTAGESIQTESSYKYTLDGFRAIARGAGYESRTCWVDERALFSVHLLQG